jgi:hypothetical protein
MRGEVNRLLKPGGFLLQKQAYDNVLRERDRARNAAEKLLFYIAENPVRDELVEDAGDWGYSESLAVGYPDFDWRDEVFPKRLWRIVTCEMDREEWRQDR